MKKKIIVCGATGFIGRNMLEHFARDAAFDVVGVHHLRPPFEIPGVRWEQADLRVEADVGRIFQGAEIVVQAAATTSGAGDIKNRPYIHVTDNAVMNSIMLRQTYELNVGQFVFFSCTVMYPSSEQPLKETDFDASKEIMPAYFGVGWTKVYVEKMCEFYSRLGRTRFTVIRHSNIYGPHDKYDLARSHVYGATIRKVMTAADGQITVWGPGTEARDLLYVGDLCEFVDTALARQKSPYELLNVGLGSAIEIKDLVRMIVDLAVRPLEVKHDLSKPHIPSRVYLDVTRAAERFGWRPKTTLEDGTKRTIAWFDANRASLNV